MAYGVYKSVTECHENAGVRANEDQSEGIIVLIDGWYRKSFHHHYRVISHTFIIPCDWPAHPSRKHVRQQATRSVLGILATHARWSDGAYRIVANVPECAGSRKRSTQTVIMKLFSASGLLKLFTMDLFAALSNYHLRKEAGSSNKSP